MRRRGADFRRPVRRRVQNAVSWALCSVVVVLFFIYILTNGTTNIDSTPHFSGRTFRNDRIIVGLNVTEEMLSPNSVSRQLNDQIALAKAFVIIAKENNNLQFALELGAQIRNSQIILSNAAARRASLTIMESERAIHDMSLLLYQAQQLHYDSASMIMRQKARIQVLEEQKNSASKKSSKYGQIAAEEVPKSLYCLGFRLTSIWFKNLSLQEILKDKMQVEMKLKDNNLYHFCVFSDNILATSVVVNSTAINSKTGILVVGCIPP